MFSIIEIGISVLEIITFLLVSGQRDGLTENHSFINFGEKNESIASNT